MSENINYFGIIPISSVKLGDALTIRYNILNQLLD